MDNIMTPPPQPQQLPTMMLQLPNPPLLQNLFVGSVVIDVELGRDDHSSIPHKCDQEGTGTT
ncbi:hypothetical protein L195_g037347 [Trifolium pratense]|uniref:Uncharacterized protein n=1 Tax=Trifolium pratense TaxID=57577 RepID=A0A2K3LS42_TRIPR|nr:hypothetical protein L195_g037347 [Trifolium pratense]